MNRLLALKQTTGTANDSLLSNASHDGYESAMDETMASSASMYYSMNESSLDRTLEPSQPAASHMDTTMMVDLTTEPLNPTQHKETTRSVLTPIAEPAIGYMSPKRNRRNVVDTSTPVPSKGTTPSPRKRTLVQEETTTVRKLTAGWRSENAENAVDNKPLSEETSTDIVSQSIISCGDVSIVTQVAAEELLASVDPMDVSTGVAATEIAPAEISAGIVAVESQMAATTGNKTTQTKEPVAAAPAAGSRRSLSKTFRRQSSVRGRGTLATIGETATSSSSSLDTDVQTAVRRITRRSVSLAHSSPAATLRQTLKTITPRKSIALRRQSAVNALTAITEHNQPAARAPNTARSSTFAVAPNAVSTTAARRRSVRSMALVVAAATAEAVVRASPHRVAIVRTRKSIAPSNAQPPTLTTNSRRSMAVAAAAPTTGVRKVLLTTAAAVLAQNPTRRRTSLMSTTPGRRMSTLAAKPRTPMRPLQQPPPTQTRRRSVMPVPAQPAQTKRRSVMPVPAPPPPSQSTASKPVVAGSSQVSSGYFACTQCNKHFLQQSRLNTHMRTHAASAATITASLTCMHCMRAFDKAIALRNHQLEHCAKISTSDRRRLLKQRDIEDNAAATATTSAAAAKPRGASALSSSVRAMSPSRAHRGVYQTPNKLIKCNVCAKQFGDPLSFALHAETHSVV